MKKHLFRKKRLCFLLCFLLLFTLAGCGTKKDPFADCVYITPEMYERATSFCTQNTDESRLADVLRRAKAGEEITIGVIGGSITQGYSASTQDKCYASLVKKWWEERFPDATVHFVNAGIGGTSSYYGVHRLERDLLRYRPDFVIVEFSVNDSNDSFYKRSYDNLVYRLMTAEWEPAVMLLFMTMEQGYSAQENDAPVGFHYNLPMISYKNAVLEEIAAGNFAWKDISPDDIHPNDRGHAVIGELFSVYLDDVYARLKSLPKEKTPFKQSILTKPSYIHAHIAAPGDLIAGAGESANLDEGSITFEVKAQRIGIMYKKYTNSRGGMAEVLVDGVSLKTLNADFSGGWGNYEECEEVFAGDNTTHRVEIRWSENNTGDWFEITGIFVAD